ncbi:type VI immunity family protein [Cystobacter ferrugineus]|uniref:type VI immunity family protein n=1 Tax=Cystobacter ferrugineus TaxID=83449 RepID=UPI001FECEC96|nr:type VI immunity family protein [Cystobacter ferrugineus]
MIRFAFYLPHDHPEIAEGVRHAVEVYMRGVGEGPKTIRHSFTNDDEGDALTVERWSYVRRLLSSDRPFRFIEELPEDIADRMEKRGYATRVILDGGPRSRNGYEFHYQARIPWRTPSRDTVSLLFATLPTEYLHEHGPTKVRELALEMASQLRFASGHVGFALRLYWPLRRADESIRSSGHDLPTYREFARLLEPWLEPLPLTETTGEQGNLYNAMGFTQEEVRRWSRRFLD